MRRVDEAFENYSRKLAQQSSRRDFMTKIGRIFVGAAFLTPVLPISRSLGAARTDGDGGSETSCDYWKYCGLGGNLCACCGGSSHQCPVGTTVSKLYWVGTCKSAADGKNYIVAYRDCCGQTACGKCLCINSRGERPGYNMGLNGEVDWCMGDDTAAVHCTTSAVLGSAA